MDGRLRDDPGEINADLAHAPEAHAVRAALDRLRAGLVADGGNVELVDVEDSGTVVLEMQGSCHACPAQTQTLRRVIEPALRAAVRGVTAVVAV